ncbi:cystathionine gamma-synthase [Auraticoccus monumenti]|uniref:Cystathionine gamma-synthase n=1 Tax=Auraticoccus monumenti TaxID=675864 RepID=A0A1G7D1U9_9ACTN|nr:cystathionine gamma-synthase [Auraticoccus monumenti]SDE45463.1 cystathionine gamma-synthase [Auraticoccus monumenti]
MTEQRDETGFSTRAIHLGIDPDPLTGAIAPPVFQTSTFLQDAVAQPRNGYEYARCANPTRDLLQRQVAGLEGGRHAFSVASGLAAEDLVLRAALRPGGHVVTGSDAYGGTFRLLEQVWGPWGISTSSTELGDPATLDAHLADLGEGVLVWVETPSNPFLQVVDLAACAEVCRRHGAVLVVDNTFASPYLQRPLSLGAHVVVHSATKYLAGHSDSVTGVVVVDDDELAQRIGFLQNAAGAVSGPMDAWLTIRGLKTLAVRMDRHCANAQVLAEWLVGHPAVSAVHYPGLPDHPGHEVAARQMSAFGGVVSFQLRGGRGSALAVAEATEVFLLAESLGGVESLVVHPGEMTHASVKGTPRAVPDDMLRLSVGIEDVEDLQADLDRALSTH